MDIRTQKTKRCIINAFLELRSQKPIGKITVKELADKAVINKATFYHYYTDIYDLSEQLQFELVEEIVSEIEHPRYLLENPKAFILEIARAMTKHSEKFDTLFDQSELASFVDKFEQVIKKLFYMVCPDYKRSFELDLIITVLIQGNFHAFLTCPPRDSTRAIKLLGEINEQIMSKLPRTTG